jgi:phenylpropionate dioxygenase-like ring-hydroxylating dioxygenase large terminal subunit
MSGSAQIACVTDRKIDGPPADPAMFDHRHYRGVRRPLPEAETLPGWCYTSEEFLRREIDEVFLKSWCFVGRTDEMPEIGSYAAIDTPAGPVVVVRGADDGVRAFVNSCRHRGCKIAEGRGRAGALVCPYHGWTYGLDGSLRAASHMDRTAGFDPRRFGLIEIRAETWDGFIFVTYDRDQASLADYLGNMPAHFASHNAADLVCVGRTEYLVDCNWKLLIENALEDYHTRMVHRGSIGTQVAIREPTVGEWDSLYVEQEVAMGVLPGESTSFARIPTLKGAATHRSYFTIIYPNTQFCFTQDCMWWLSVTPRSAATCNLEVGYCFPRATTQRADFDTVAARYFHRWKLTATEDNAIAEQQQKGLEARFRTPGPLSWKDELVNGFDLWILDRVVPVPDEAKIPSSGSNA